ncbi:monovalent cation/H(+) antiporter subunit G [Tepidibacter formicigenes]|jgi:multicomponent Na+:H+ antiporter subunit G|uniref:Multisubunit sodium/proton antiporter, MrpG subunit n=1 Tax=Tepidibacter formicigenes DSM 15518 TaxID=1123349 RepID=A0A1M6NWK0_9FIRM|nr:monovalent cation/H(+) antiporter subunit G [Tepidibacter formicigenes]SHK00119.1 multisubunit sodium/proton antiporter, MrpG subunit [Tepidibacter formicigenes DSM 15518]
MKMILVSILLFGGLFFFSVGTIGLLRFDDVFTRAHGAAKCDTLGAVFSLLALVVYNGFGFTSFKLIMVIVFLWITNPTATHLITRAEFNRRKHEKN